MYPYLPASIKVSRGSPSPMAIISHNVSTLVNKLSRCGAAITLHVRILHTLAPVVHNRRPLLSQVSPLGDNIRSIESWEVSLVWGILAHLPEEATFRVWMVSRDIERSLRGIQAFYYTQARRVDCTLGLLRVLKCYTHLCRRRGSIDRKSH